MKYFCEACERLVPPASFRVEDGLLVLKCSRCKVEMRGGIEQDDVPAPAPVAPKAPKAPAGPVIALGEDEAEPDPIENEPTRRMAVPAALLQAIEDEARENRRKKEKDAAAKDTASKDAAREKERPREKAPVPVLEPTTPSRVTESVKAPEPVKVSEFLKASEPVKPAEVTAAKDKSSRPASEPAGSANLTVLRLSEMQQGQTPSAAEDARRAAGPALRVVRDTTSTPTVGAASSAPAGPDDAFMPPAEFCPKCVGPRKEGSVVCPFCGLDFSRFRQDDFRPSPNVASAWLGVQELWDSKSAHDKVLALASERGELPALGRLYRVRLARQPEDAMALRGREEVLRLAAAGSMMLATPPPDKGTKIRMAGLGVFLFLLVVLVVAMGVRMWKLTMGAP
ncbi:MAG: hypothetical protein ABW123_04830 [Cystobacter sp.]